MNKVDGKLSREHLSLFEPLALSMTDYLSKKDNYLDLVKYLLIDIQTNSDNHILTNDEIFNGYKSLINSRGQSAIKFMPGIDISTDAGIKKLEHILTTENIINQTNNNFSIDIAFLPHIETFPTAYSFIKKNVEHFIKVNRGSANSFTMHSTASLNIRNYDSIGASFIEEGRKKI